MGAMSRYSPESGSQRVIEWAVSARTMAEEVESGDLHIVAPHALGVLLAVVDGLGHGAEAAVAARTAAEVLQQHPQESLTALVQRCHSALRKTRGVVMSLAAFDTETWLMTWLGIGNVVGTLFRADTARKPSYESLLLRGGVIGYQIPALRPVVLPVLPNDILVFATDGVRDEFGSYLPQEATMQDRADAIIGRLAKDSDDALVLVARYVGARA
jgi:serine phosphatase RsbU (regulator of sigma subunit)